MSAALLFMLFDTEGVRVPTERPAEPGGGGTGGQNGLGQNGGFIPCETSFRKVF